MDKEFKKRFLTNTDETGRYVVKSLITGKTYFVEPIDDHSEKAPIWGDWQPGTQKYTGSYGKKHKGSVTSKESLITKENGFSKIHELNPGESPDSYIDRIDKEYQKQMKEKSKNK